MDVIDDVLESSASVTGASQASTHAPTLETAIGSDMNTAPADNAESEPAWTYPTRLCRICYEDVVPTVTMYPPGLPPAFQRPQVEYISDEDYGRLIRPCKCRGGMRYIHEKCLLRSRTHTSRANSLWKCHECGHQFNFKRLTLQRYLGSKISSGLLAVILMVIVMFFLGFVADPLINLYVDPYDTLVGHEDYWREVDINRSNDSLSGWSLHFLKGLISMGLVGFVKTALLNPFQWWNLRTTGWSSGRSSGTSSTGRDRAVNISWIAVVIGISTAFYLFYQWTQSIIGKTLQKIGNNIVDTQLSGDDDDIKPPAGFRFSPAPIVANGTSADDDADVAADIPAVIATSVSEETTSAISTKTGHSLFEADDTNHVHTESFRISKSGTEHAFSSALEGAVSENNLRSETVRLREQWPASETTSNSILDSARDQGWSFVDIPK